MDQAQEKLRIVFMGTPEFAARILQSLLDWDGCQVVAAYSQPDRPRCRGRVCKPCEVKALAESKGVPVHQPVNFKSAEAVEELRALRPDVLVVAAYGLILPQVVLDIPKLAPVNVHASLLPRYRGAAPIQRAILNGDFVSGVTIMRMEAGLDSGPILMQRALAIDVNDTYQTLHDDFALLGGLLLIETLKRLPTGALTPIRQDDALAVYAPKLSKEEGRIDWTLPAQQVHNLVRAMHPWPGAYFDWTGADGQSLTLKVHPGAIGPDLINSPVPGTILGVEGDYLMIACADAAYMVTTIQPSHRKPMSAKEFYCGYLSRCPGN